MNTGPQPGALRYQREDGEWITAQPGDSLYSTASMVAQQFWDGSAWIWIDCDEL